MTRIWVGLFSFWLVFLSGVLTPWGGSPGILQVLRLKNLFELKQLQATRLQNDVQNLKIEIQRLNQSRVAQEKEIRKVLGYAAKNEFIFELSE